MDSIEKKFFYTSQGAERKTRDEDRRAQKRRMNPTSRKKLEDMYHTPCERYEFYSMADLTKEPVLFKPDDPVDKVNVRFYFLVKVDTSQSSVPLIDRISSLIQFFSHVVICGS